MEWLHRSTGVIFTAFSRLVHCSIVANSSESSSLDIGWIGDIIILKSLL
jgi:hypothetical protein